MYEAEQVETESGWAWGRLYEVVICNWPLKVRWDSNRIPLYILSSGIRRRKGFQPHHVQRPYAQVPVSKTGRVCAGGARKLVRTSTSLLGFIEEQGGHNCNV